MELWALPEVVLRVFGVFPVLAVFCTVFALAFDLMKRRKKCGNYPPGPRALPFLGNLLQVDLNNPHLSFAKVQLKASIVFAKYGDWWKGQRRFALSTLKNFGLGKKSLELRIAEEAGFLSQAFEGEQDCPFDPHFHLTYATANIICSIIFGERFEYRDEKFLTFLHMLEESFILEGGFWGQLMNTFPFVQYLPGPQNKIHENHDKAIRFLEERITRHKESWDPDNPRDFIDAFFTQREKMKHSPNTSFPESNMKGTLFSLFAAGTETTSTTLNWALLFMVLHPDGTTIFPNITSALYDEDVWLTPREFNPGHFLNSDGMFVKPEAFIPFSAGHRVCLGEQLAKKELFIFFTSLLQHFTFFLPENEPRPNFREAKYGITLCSPPYRLCVKTR
ncbi:cytochrome P450 2D3-like [Rhinoraja longicauda]